MALQKQLVPLQIDGGLDTKFDSKQEEPGFLRVLQNVVFETVKKFRKRNGYTQLDLLIESSSYIQNPIILSRLKQELLCFNATNLYSYSTSLARWTRKGPLYSMQTKSSSVVKNADNLVQSDSICVDNFQIFVWEDNQGDVRYSVQDSNDASFIVADALVAAGERPVVSNIGNDVYVIYGDGADIAYKSFSILMPGTLSAATVVASDRDLTEGLISCYMASDSIVVGYNANNTGDDVSIFKITSTGTSSIIQLTSESATDALNVFVDPSNRIIITWSDGTDFKIAIYPLNLNTSLLAPTLVESAVVSNCVAIDDGASYRLYYEVVQADTLDNYVKQADVSLAGSVTGIAVFTRSVGLAGTIIKQADSIYIPVVLESALQSSYFLLDEEGNIVTKWANQTASNVITKGVLPHTCRLTDSTHLLSYLFRNRLRTENGTFFTTNGVGKVSLNFDVTEPFSNAELADALHICAGVLRLYDGATVTEHGFHVYPEDLELQATATTGGFIPDGNYGYVAVYRWTDNTGKDHRSAPTPLPLEVVLTGGTSTQTATIRVPTLRLTEKIGVIIELYRTEDDGTQYYKVTSDNTPVLNDKSVDFVDIVDTIADATLISREALYTTGGVLENVPAPACNQVETYNGERLVVSAEDGPRINFSKQTSEGSPVEFTDLIYRELAPAGGDIVVLKAMAEKLIIFQKDSTHYVAGEGPNNLGQQDTLTKPEIIATDIGALNSNSAVLSPNGILFKSRKGIWRLGGNMGLDYIGARVERFNGQTITSAQIVGELNQIRFVTSEERALVYNYNLDRWDTFENHGGLSSVVIGNDYYYLREDGALYKEDRTSFSDAGSPIKLKFETAWLQVGDINGFQRVYHLVLLGNYKSAHKLRVKVAYDYNEAYVSEVIIDPSDFIDAAAYGSDATYGESSPYGGNGAIYQPTIYLEQQKCSAIKISVEDLQDVAGEGLTISGISARVGLKEGSTKNAASSSFGTE